MKHLDTMISWKQLESSWKRTRLFAILAFGGTLAISALPAFALQLAINRESAWEITLQLICLTVLLCSAAIQVKAVWAANKELKRIRQSLK